MNKKKNRDYEDNDEELDGGVTRREKKEKEKKLRDLRKNKDFFE